MNGFILMNNLKLKLNFDVYKKKDLGQYLITSNSI
jgi:hypothetical protein